MVHHACAFASFSPEPACAIANSKMVSRGKLKHGSWWSMPAKKNAVVAQPPGFLIPAAVPKMARIFIVAVGDEPMAAKP